jgi:hypothetical protein
MDSGSRKLGYFYYEEEPGGRSSAKRRPNHSSRWPEPAKMVLSFVRSDAVEKRELSKIDFEMIGLHPVPLTAA